MAFKYTPAQNRMSVMDINGWTSLAAQYARQSAFAEPGAFAHVYGDYPYRLRDDANTGGLLLLGAPGTAKTTAALAAVRPSAEAGRSVRMHLLSVLAVDLAKDVITQAERQATDAGILVLDDIASIGELDLARSVALGRIITQRNEKKFPTIATADADYEALIGILGFRGETLVDRLREGAEVHLMTGESRRAEASFRQA